MKQIASFSQRSLHNGEHDQLHTNFATAIETETPQKLGIVNEFTAYNAARATEKLALQQEQGSAHTLSITDSDGVRDEQDTGFCMLVESHMYHPSHEVRESARRIKRIIDQYGILRKINYNEESSKLSNRNAEISTNYAADLAALANGTATQWLNSLNSANDQFIAQFGNRSNEQATKLAITVLEARMQTDAAWETIFTRINALAVVNGEATYAPFIDKINTNIEYFKTVLNTRKAKKAKDELK